MTLHEAEASPVAGGEARASGTVRIDAGALSHPEAVNVELEAEGFNPRSVVASLALKESATVRGVPASTVGKAPSDEEADTYANAPDDGASGIQEALRTGLQQLLSKNSALDTAVQDAITEAVETSSSSPAALPNTTFGLPQAMYDKIVPAAAGTAKATIAGPHAAPVVDAQWDVKDAGLSGDLKITRGRVSAQVRAPAIELSGAAGASYPSGGGVGGAHHRRRARGGSSRVHKRVG